MPVDKRALETERIQILEKVRETVNYSREQFKLLRRKRPFVIVVCGAFSTGKSSLLNALLGCHLPTGHNPITKRITRIEYGAFERIVLEDREKNREYEISWEVAKYIILNEWRDDCMESLQIRFEIPSVLLKMGVVFVDTPGFEDDAEEKLDQMTREEIARADFCIVNFACNHFGDKYERAFLEELQKLTNGNFVMVLNCSNYLSGLRDLKDVEKRADMILRYFGNPRIGYGKYFIVNSEGEHSDLDGLDGWLEGIIRRHAKAIQSDVLCARTMAAIDSMLEEGKESFYGSMNLIYTIREADLKICGMEIREIERGNHEKVREFHNRQKQVLNEFEAELLREIRGGLSNIEAKNFNDKAFDAIGKAMDAYAKNLHKKISSLFPETASVFPSIGGVHMQMTKAAHLSRKRSFFDIDRYTLGAHEYYYNDYLAATMKDIREVTVPGFRIRLNQYFEAAEEKLIKNLCIQRIRGQNQRIGDCHQYLQNLCRELLELKKNKLAFLSFQNELAEN